MLPRSDVHRTAESLYEYQYPWVVSSSLDCCESPALALKDTRWYAHPRQKGGMPASKWGRSCKATDLVRWKLVMRGDSIKNLYPPPIRSLPEAAVLVMTRLLQHPVLGDTSSGVPRAGIAGKYGPKQLAGSSVTWSVHIMVPSPRLAAARAHLVKRLDTKCWPTSNRSARRRISRFSSSESRKVSHY